MDSTSLDQVGADIDAAAKIAGTIGLFVPAVGPTVALVASLIDKVGWPFTRYIIERWASPNQEWTSADTDRVKGLVNTPLAAYEAGIVPLAPN
jgi:hypothetical protein